LFFGNRLSSESGFESFWQNINIFKSEYQKQPQKKEVKR